MKRLTCVAAFELPVEEAERILDALGIVKRRECLSGSQRQVLDEVISEVEFAITAETGGVVQISSELNRSVLRCFWNSQDWMSTN